MERTPICLFLWRRAFRSTARTVTRADVLEAFSVSASTASKALSAVAESEEGQMLLIRAAKAVKARETAQPPSWADEADLMASLQGGRLEFMHTGLRDVELPVNIVRWSRPMSATPGVLQALVEACTAQLSVHIRYVSLRRGARAKDYWMAPLGLEQMGDQWRVFGHDLEDERFQVKTFVLPRIVTAVPSKRRLPSGLIRANSVDATKSFTPTLNGRLTEEQRAVVRHELLIDAEGRLELPERGIYEYARRHTKPDDDADVVWPLLERL